MSEKNPLDLLKELLVDDEDEAEDNNNSYQNNFNNSYNNGRNEQTGNVLNSFMNSQGLDKMRQVMDMMQGMQGDSRTALLNSLRPHLSSRRQGKLDKAIEILTITQAFQAMRNTNKKGD